MERDTNGERYIQKGTYMIEDIYERGETQTGIYTKKNIYSKGPIWGKRYTYGEIH